MATAARQGGSPQASLPDNKPRSSGKCKPVQTLKKLIKKLPVSCMHAASTSTHSHQQGEDVRPLPTAAAAVQTDAGEPQKVAMAQRPQGSRQAEHAQQAQRSHGAQHAQQAQTSQPASSNRTRALLLLRVLQSRKLQSRFWMPCPLRCAANAASQTCGLCTNQISHMKGPKLSVKASRMCSPCQQMQAPVVRKEASEAKCQAC